MLIMKDNSKISKVVGIKSYILYRVVVSDVDASRIYLE